MKHTPVNGSDFVSYVGEFEDIISFAEHEDLSVEICRQQLRCLWTAFCIRWNRIPDTGSYDSEMIELHKAMIERVAELPDCIRNYTKFYNYMCEYLV